VNKDDDTDGAVAIGPRFIASGGFEALYREGMTLIEEVAAYLDGAGRSESRDLPREAAFVYATESMRLTTRLMQLASWLLLQKAVHEGEITAENGRTEKDKVQFSGTRSVRGGPGWDDLPEGLKNYIGKGDRLFERVAQFDKLERAEVPDQMSEPKSGGVVDQMTKLQAAFNSAFRSE